MAINSKSTKAEILAAYKALEKENKNLALEVKKGSQLQNNLQTADNKKIIESTSFPKLKDMLNIIQSLDRLQIGFGSSVSNLSEQLITEATKLAEIRDAIAEEQNQLESLHNLTEIDSEIINILLTEYQESAKQFTEEFQQQHARDREELNLLIKTWSKEKETYLREIKTRNELVHKTQQREAEEYQYNLDLARDIDESEYEQEKKARYQELAETRQELEQQWQQRETELAKQEQDYTEAQVKVDAFDAELKAKIKQGQEEGKGIGTYQAKVKADLINKEIAGEKQNYQLQVEALEQTISNQEVRINQLGQQLDLALQQVQNLAVKAIEGTSNRNSFEAMKQIALEQAKTQTKGK